MQSICRLLIPSFASLLLVACGDDGGETNKEDPCNPIDGTGCMLPWPSSAYIATDGATQTGYRVAIPIEAMPKNIDKISVDPAPYNRWDGFSPTGPILSAFATGVSSTGLPSYKNPDESLAATSPIILVDLDTGERAPFFAEIDANTTDINARNLIIRPLVRLHTNAHYGVIITKKVKAADGSELVSPPNFVKVRDGGALSGERGKRLTDGWDAIQGQLSALGLSADDIALAWDFRTASDEFLRNDLTRMREQALPAFGTNGSSLSFTVTTNQPVNATTEKRFLGTYKAPDFLTDKERDDSIIRRDADGNPVAMGYRDARFAAVIPKCVTNPEITLPRPVVVFGHGLFGSGEEFLSDGFVADLAQDYCFIAVGGDWIGLSERQIPLAPLAVNDMNKGPWIAEKLGQSIIDFMSLAALARGPMVTSDAFKVNGNQVMDPTRVFYVGGSLGGNMGSAMLAYEPVFEKAVLAVPGGVWSMMFERSAAWTALLGAAQGAYPDPEIYQLVVSFLGLAFEPYDPITTAAHIIKDPLFGQSAKNVVMWYTLGDSLVTNITTEMVLREMGMPMLAPTVHEAWRVPTSTGPWDNAVIVYDEHPSPMPPETNTPPRNDNGTHSGVNNNPSALRLVQNFLLLDTIAPQCKNGGNPVPCDCNTNGGGVCD